ncbi:hypothetical protein ONE63_010313 [Megalurothrips usitatus]|uniref:F-box domain-containing protein n=1 Tax=Megalurothrips usitatus TaxID=439358 RepID=A0AAV7XM59_9NEOP|nr:hypothetical protein ONE63_010313 [Megalurothrips usitatus]
MLTRRRARREGVVLPSTWEVGEMSSGVVIAQPTCSPPQLSTTRIEALSDLTLVDIFSYLTTDGVVEVSKVCQRWSELCRSRRLWAGRRMIAPNEVSFMNLLRVLRRSSTVVPYTALQVDIGTSYFQTAAAAWFTDNGDCLHVSPTTPLLLLLCLRELVKPAVTRLTLCGFSAVTDVVLTQCEAFHLWEVIASKTNLVHFNLSLPRSCRLVSSRYQWPADRRGNLSSISLNLGVGGGHLRAALPALESLIRVNGPHLTSLRLRSVDLQSTLRWCSASVVHLHAVLLPSLPALLARMRALQYLHLSPDHDATLQPALLKRILDLPNIRATLRQLDLSYFRKVEPGAAVAETLASLTQCRGLKWLQLAGFAGLLADPVRGPPALTGLLTELGLLRWISLAVAPCVLLLDDSSKECGSCLLGSLADLLPQSLRLLKLHGGYSPCRREACRSAAVLRPTSLRRLLGRQTPLHIQVTEHACHSMRGLRSQFIILPHAEDAYCQDCREYPRLVTALKTFTSYSIEELCKRS